MIPGRPAAHEHEHHGAECKHKRMQQGRVSKSDVLTDARLKRRLRRWYCKPKHTRHYYTFQGIRVAVLVLWLSFYLSCPGFRRGDIRYQFLCVIRSRVERRYRCVLLQASLFEVGWSTNFGLLTFCLLLSLRQLLYVFPFVLSCRCLQCRTKRCLSSCRKECRSHYFQRILGVVMEPKRSVEPTGCWPCCPRRPQQYDSLQCTDFYSPRLADRYYISHLCYENAHLMEKVLPDMGSANASDEFSSLGNLASIAMKLDTRTDEMQAETERAADAAADKVTRNPFLARLRGARGSASKAAIGPGVSEAEEAAKAAIEAGAIEAEKLAKAAVGAGDSGAKTVVKAAK